MNLENRKVIVAGSRSIDSYLLVSVMIDRHTPAIEKERGLIEIVHGGAEGVDSCASDYAESNGFEETVFEPAWDEHGKAAGPIRNQEMAEYGDMLIAVWDGESSGTRDMIEKALDEGLDVYVKVVG